MKNPEKVKRASSTTTIKIGIVEAPVKLYKTIGKSKGEEFEKATPSGNAFDVKLYVGDEPFVPPEEEATDPLAAVVEQDEPVMPVEKAVDVETGEVFDLDEIRTGVRKADDTFVDLTDALEDAEEESRLENLDIVGFIRREIVPRSRIIGSYYVGTDDPGAAKVLRVLDEAMRNEQRSAVVRWTKRKGQTLGVMVNDRSGALLILEMEFAENFRVPNDACLAHKTAAVTDAAIENASNLVAGMSMSPADLDVIRDRRAENEEGLVEAALAGELDHYAPPVDAGDPMMEDLEALLQASAKASTL